MLFCIIVAQPGALFLLLRLLSGKVRLTGLRTTGSDGGREGKGDKQRNRERGKEGRDEEGLARAEERDGEGAESRKTDSERWEWTV